MFIRIVHHWAKPGQTEVGQRFIDENGDKMASYPGFRYRIGSSRRTGRLTLRR